MATMDEMYSDGSDHEACEVCGCCITCHDCEMYGCGPYPIQPSNLGILSKLYHKTTINTT